MSETKIIKLRERCSHGGRCGGQLIARVEDRGDEGSVRVVTCERCDHTHERPDHPGFSALCTNCRRTVYWVRDRDGDRVCLSSSDGDPSGPKTFNEETGRLHEGEPGLHEHKCRKKKR